MTKSSRLDSEGGRLARPAKRPFATAAALVLGLATSTFAGCRISAAADGSPSTQTKGLRAVTMSTRTYAKPSDDVLRHNLTPMQYEVTQNESTEPPFRNQYWNNHAAGLYVDVATGEPLFSSTDKFDSGTGWPSFTRPVEPGRVVDKPDHSFGAVRTEVRSKAGGSHLGHVFDDGPAPTGLRYCINSAAIRLIPVDRLEADGYGNYRALFEDGKTKPGQGVNPPDGTSAANTNGASVRSPGKNKSAIPR